LPTTARESVIATSRAAELGAWPALAPAGSTRTKDRAALPPRSAASSGRLGDRAGDVGGALDQDGGELSSRAAQIFHGRVAR
jgi:hypothetical protein